MAPPKTASARRKSRDDTSKVLSTPRYLAVLWGVTALDILLALEYPLLAVVLAVPLLLLVRRLTSDPSGVRSSLLARYRYSGPFLLERRIPLPVVAAALAACPIGFQFGTAPGILASGAGLATLIHGISRSGGALFLTRRFLSLGDQRLYYEDMRKVVLRSSGIDPGSPRVLEIHPLAGDPLLVEQGKFPTNARKAHKIVANREAKMWKVTTRLFKQLEQYPNVVIEGSPDAPVPAGKHPGRMDS
jgi:hypothetical protein